MRSTERLVSPSKNEHCQSGPAHIWQCCFVLWLKCSSSWCWEGHIRSCGLRALSWAICFQINLDKSQLINLNYLLLPIWWCWEYLLLCLQHFFAHSAKWQRRRQEGHFWPFPSQGRPVAAQSLNATWLQRGLLLCFWVKQLIRQSPETIAHLTQPHPVTALHPEPLVSVSM